MKITKKSKENQQNLFSIERELQEIETRIERFKARFVTSPCDGIVFRVSANVGEGGDLDAKARQLWQKHLAGMCPAADPADPHRSLQAAASAARRNAALARNSSSCPSTFR